jgi:hypothetical protein
MPINPQTTKEEEKETSASLVFLTLPTEHR